MNLKFPVWIGFVVAYFLLFIIDYRPTGNLDAYITYTFFINAIVTSYSIFSDPHPYSLNKVFWIFNFIFFAVIPTAQYQQKEIPWGNNISQYTFLLANIATLFAFLIYKAVRKIVLWKRSSQIIFAKDWASPAYNQKIKLQGRFIFFVLCGILIAVIGVDNLWLRGNLSETIDTQESTLYLLYNEVLRGGILYFVLACIVLTKRKMMSRGTLTIIVLLAFIANFPLSTPRFFTATFYISILLVFNFKFLTTRNGFTYMLIAILLVVFPLLGVTRYKKDKALQTLENAGEIFKGSFLVGDFDAYSSFCRTIEQVSKEGITWGKQLLTVLLFFVPRSVWPEKAVGSGAYVYGEMRYKFTNISCPYIAEGYINFGVLGLVLFMAVLAFILTRYDDFYWKVKNHSGVFLINYNVIYYPVFLGLLFFLLRGDLLSSYSHTLGLFVAGYIMHRIIRS